MTRPDSQRISGRPAVAASKITVGYEVHAKPVDQTVMPAPDYEMEGLISGLAAINPKLARYTTAMDNQEELEGDAARAKGEDKDDTKSRAWARGYMRMDGATKALQDRSAILSRYETEFDKDASSPEQLEAFIAKVVGEQTKGSQDPSFLEGYNKNLVPQLEKIRAGFFDHHRKAVVERTEANGTFLLEQGIRERAGKGLPLDDAFLEGARTTLNKVGVTNSRFNDIVFSAAKRLGDEGNFAIYDAFKRDRPDGTKGMYFIPAWKEKIDAAQIHAQNVFLTNTAKAAEAAKKAREEKQDTALFSVFDKAFNGDVAGARTEFDQLRTSGLFTRAADLIKWETHLGTTMNKEARGDQLVTENNLLSSIYQGKAGIRQVLEADLAPKQKKSLLSEVRRVQTENRTLAAQQERDGKAIYRTPQFTAGESYIRGQLASTPSVIDINGVGSAFDRSQRAAAILEYTERASNVKSAGELPVIRDDIVKRYQERKAKWNDDQKEKMTAGRTRYSNMAEVATAYRAGGMTFDEALYYEQAFLSKQPQKK